jgi:eukaryotic-like serine/threonine-protein kinase
VRVRSGAEVSRRRRRYRTLGHGERGLQPFRANFLEGKRGKETLITTEGTRRDAPKDMSPEQARLNEIFSEALAKPFPEERQRYLEAACGADRELLRQVEGLLEADAESGSFLHGNVLMPASAAVGEGSGSVIGRYKLLEQIGEGGFGVVFMAEQQEPVRRLVALKILKPGMDTKEVIARFEAGRQALAMMDHPNIARVLDGGATASGRPYFVMDLVKGIPITAFCEKHHLSVEERLRLFVKVCAGVQHAHQKGVIHRDLKPSNVLVLHEPGLPGVPKVIDSGISKAIGQKLTARTLFTRFEQLLGTPAYMSPEQAEWSGLDIDTRSDIYSLGVLLYELLTGCTPINPKELLASGLEAMRRTIREKDPLRPSSLGLYIFRVCQRLGGVPAGPLRRCQARDKPSLGRRGSGCQSRCRGLYGAGDGLPSTGPDCPGPRGVCQRDGHSEAETPERRDRGYRIRT